MSKKPGTNDYFSGTKKGEPTPKEQAAPDGNKRRWWEMKGPECAESIGGTVDALQKAQGARIKQQVINQALYGNRRLSGAQAAARQRALAQSQGARANAITFNAVQSIIDTGTSKVGETKPRPYFLTSGGNYKQQRKAKRLNKYVEGVFYENKTYDMTPQMFRDCAIDGDGFIFAFERGGKIRHQPVSSLELWVDEEEAQYGKPRNLHRCQVVDRDELAGYFADNEKAVAAIRAVAKAKDAHGGETTSDMVSIVTSWHLGSMQPDGTMKGGKYAMALLGGAGFMLVEPEDWPHDFFPFARMPWCEPPTGSGFWSQGLCEQLQGEQIELNKELQYVQRAMQLSAPKLLVPIGSKVVDQHLNNEIWTVLRYAGNSPPQFHCPEPVHQAYFENPNRIIERMYRKAGWSEMSAAAVKPPGLNSGVAQREFVDNESDRHKHTQKLYDAAHLMLAEITVALSIEAAAAGRLEAVRVPGKQSFDSVDFKQDLKGLKRSEFTLHCYSVSRLPKDPAGRLETIQEHIQAGIISLRQGRKLLDFPDLEAFETLADAQENIITKVLDAIVDDDDYAPPEPTDDLSLAQELVLEYIQHYRALDLEEERMDKLRQWNLQVQELTVRALPAAMPGAAPGMGPPQAAPMPQPQSELVPNAPGMQAAA
jgi:hypothetical protein